MTKALSLAAALALLPMSAAVADDLRGPSEDALEAAAEAFEARKGWCGQRQRRVAQGQAEGDYREGPEGVGAG